MNYYKDLFTPIKQNQPKNSNIRLFFSLLKPLFNAAPLFVSKDWYSTIITQGATHDNC